MQLLKWNDSYLGITGFTKKMTNVIAVKYSGKTLYFPTINKYLDGNAQVSDAPVPCWELTCDNFLVTNDYKMLTSLDGVSISLYAVKPEMMNIVKGVHLVHPSTNIEKLIANGIVFLPTKDCSNLRAQLDSIKHSRVGKLLHLDPEFASPLCSKDLLDVLHKLYGNDYHLTTFSSNKLVKNVDNRHWHVDYPYHNLQSPYLNSLPELWLSLQLIIPLDDFTSENGATDYIPNSHHYLAWPNIHEQTVEKLLIKKGWMALFIGSLWHSQGVNLTDQSRIALLANFSPTFISAKDSIAEQVKSIKNPYLHVEGNVVKIS